MVSHWFSASQWQLPNESDYLKLQALFARVAEEKHQRCELEWPHHQLVSNTVNLTGNMPACWRSTNLCGVIFLYRLLFRIRMSGCISLYSIIRQTPL